MGSTGSGSFSDYSKRKPIDKEDDSGGSSNVDNCLLAFSTGVEEISRCYYYLNYTNVPPVNTVVAIVFNGVRLVAENALGEEIGYLPTRYNYLLFCMNAGYKYTGVVVTSSKSPTPSIRIDIVPE